MFKKILKTLATAAVVFCALTFSAKVFAAYTTTSSAYLHNGYWVYNVTLHNNSRYRLYCTLTATNGAYYSGYVQPWGRSGRMRINDINATYTWSCNRA